MNMKYRYIFCMIFKNYFLKLKSLQPRHKKDKNLTKSIQTFCSIHHFPKPKDNYLGIS